MPLWFQLFVRCCDVSFSKIASFAMNLCGNKFTACLNSLLQVSVQHLTSNVDVCAIPVVLKVFLSVNLPKHGSKLEGNLLPFPRFCICIISVIFQHSGRWLTQNGELLRLMFTKYRTCVMSTHELQSPKGNHQKMKWNQPNSDHLFDK